MRSISNTTTDDAIDKVAELLWPSVDGDLVEVKIAISFAGRAYRALLRSGLSPAQAVKTISTLALFMSGLKYDQIDGPRVRL